jgi:hypothetical protein
VVDLRPALWRLRVSLESADDPLFTVGQDRVLEVRRKRVETGAAVEHVAPSDTRGPQILAIYAVVTVAAEELVVAGAALDPVSAAITLNRIIPRTAFD